MTMSRKEFNPIADAVKRQLRIARTHDITAERAIKDLTQDLIDVFYKSNPNFDYDRFLEACEYSNHAGSQF